MKQGSLVVLADGRYARFLLFQLGIGYHVLVHGRIYIVPTVLRISW